MLQRKPLCAAAMVLLVARHATAPDCQAGNHWKKNETTNTCCFSDRKEEANIYFNVDV